MTPHFFKQTCEISSYSDTTTGGEQIRTYSVIRSDTPCLMYARRGGIRVAATDGSSEARLGEMTIVLPPEITDVREGYRVAVTDPAIGPMGSYLVQGVSPNRGLRSLLSISLSCKREP